MSEPSLVDVRAVAPKDRLEMIMSAWDALGSGAAMELCVDHDPRCMYYTLRAMHGEESFTFDYLADGPEEWRVRVEKR